MPLIAAHELAPSEGSLAIYNGLDCALTFEINDALRQLPQSNDTLIYDFERALQAPALEMMLRGFKVDQEARSAAIASTHRKLNATSHILGELVRALTDRYDPKFPNSGKQLREFFYAGLRIPPIEDHRGGETRQPMDRKTLERLEAYHHARPFVNAILLHRDLSKTLQVLETEIDPDGRWHTSYNIAGTTTGRWSSSKSNFGTGCVLPHVEALTPEGWKRVDQLHDGDMIMQWDNTTNSLEWNRCKMFSRDHSGIMFRVQTEQVKQTLTAEHRVPHYDSRMNYLYTKPAWNTAESSQAVLPLGAKFVNFGEVELPRYTAMLMADFSKEDPGWRGTFKKERKIRRFLSLAHEYELDFYEQAAPKDCRRFAIRGLRELPKKWGPWILELTLESAEDLIEEARYWDAYDRGSGFRFYSADKEQAEWFATLAHLVGRAATIRLMLQSKGSYSDTPIWAVNVKSRAHARIQRKHWSVESYAGKVYCPSVSSSYWLMREDNFISITGNSNLQNVTEELRRIFVADSGWKLCGIDLEQAEAREVGWFCGTVLGDWSYLDMIEAGDPHTFVARMCWPELSWTGDIRSDRKIAERKFYRHFTYRDATKRLSHGSNYLGRPVTMASHTKIPLEVVRKFQANYFAAFPCIPRMHHQIARELQTQGHLTTAFGRRRDFFDRTDSDETLRGAVAYMFQSATGDRLNLALWRIWKHMGLRVQLLAQLHDALYFQYSLEDNEADVLRTALSYFDIWLEAPNGRRFTIPAEAVVGFNWAHRYRLDEEGRAIEWNPQGLDKVRL